MFCSIIFISVIQANIHHPSVDQSDFLNSLSTLSAVLFLFFFAFFHEQSFKISFIKGVAVIGFLQVISQVNLTFLSVFPMNIAKPYMASKLCNKKNPPFDQIYQNME